MFFKFKTDSKLAGLKNVLGFRPKNFRLYELAFTHKSVGKQLPNGIKNSNERLEFLGDAILGSVVAELLFMRYPYKDEGFLTKTRSKIVNRKFLNHLTAKMGLDQFLIYDRAAIGVVTQNHSLYGDAFEALIGAILLDKGFTFTRKFILNRIIEPHVDIDSLIESDVNFKSRFIEWCQKEGRTFDFKQIEEIVEGKIKKFRMGVFLDGEVIGEAIAFNKKGAEKRAAEIACEALNIGEMEENNNQ